MGYNCIVIYRTLLPQIYLVIRYDHSFLLVIYSMKLMHILSFCYILLRSQQNELLRLH